MATNTEEFEELDEGNAIDVMQVDGEMAHEEDRREYCAAEACVMEDYASIDLGVLEDHASIKDDIAKRTKILVQACEPIVAGSSNRRDQKPKPHSTRASTRAKTVKKVMLPRKGCESVHWKLELILNDNKAFIGAESKPYLDALSAQRVRFLLDDFARIDAWEDVDEFKKKFAFHVRKTMRRYIHNDNLTSLIPDDIAQNPTYLERFCCSLKIIDKLFLKNGWWYIGDHARTAYHLRYYMCQMIESKKNTCVLKERLYDFCKKHNIRRDQVMASMQTMLEEGSVISFENEQVVTTTEFYASECNIFNMFASARNEPLEVAYVPDPMRRTATEEQRHAIETFAQYGFLLLTGPGGAGKSDVCLREMMHLAIDNGYRVTFLGYSHSVRKLLQQLIDDSVDDIVNSQTLTSLLFEPFSDEAVVYILDEAGMVGSVDFSKLVTRARKEGSRLVVCGDTDQLRPIKPGCPFIDLVSHCRDCGDPRLCEVTRVFRAETAELVAFCNIYRNHKIGDGNEFGNYWSLDAADPNSILPFYEDVVSTYFTISDDEIGDRFREACEECKALGASEDSVICVAATKDLCVDLHKIKRVVFRSIESSDSFVKGDPCYFTTNSEFYLNGDSCRIFDVRRDHGVIQVLYEPTKDQVAQLNLEMKKDVRERHDSPVEFREGMRPQRTTVEGHDRMSWLVWVPKSNIVVGGCVTVHRAQCHGKNFAIVIATDHEKYMQRSDWAYTAVSRAKKKNLLVGSLSAFNEARTGNNPPLDTALKRLLNTDATHRPPSPKLVNEVQTMLSMCDSNDEHSAEIPSDVSMSKTIRSKLRKAVRDMVWRRDCHKTADGRCLMDASCSCCAMLIDKDNFHCAHVQSVFLGGSNHIDNLKLACPRCNESMGTMNLCDFQMLFLPQ